MENIPKPEDPTPDTSYVEFAQTNLSTPHNQSKIELNSIPKSLEEQVARIEKITENIVTIGNGITEKVESGEYVKGNGEVLLAEKVSKNNWKDMATSQHESNIHMWKSLNEGNNPLVMNIGGLFVGATLLVQGGLAGNNTGSFVAGAMVAGMGLLTPVLAKWRQRVNEKKLGKAKEEFDRQEKLLNKPL